MIKHVTYTVDKYICSDGKALDNEKAALEWEAEHEEVSRIMQELPITPKLPTECYVQHSKNLLVKIKDDLIRFGIAKCKKNSPELLQRDPSFSGTLCTGSYLQEIFYASGGPLARAAAVLCKYDFSTGREYSDPYFVWYPKKCVEYVG